MAKKVIIVDDSLYMRTFIKDILTNGKYEVIGQASSGETAIDMIFSLKPELVTLDNILPDMLGIDILKAIRAEKLATKVIMISAVGQQSVLEEAMQAGANAYITKPFTSEKLLEVVKKTIGNP
ncbi:MAG: response regulator [Bacteroidia bacterium]|nr:response regulator [Bacteroidia bacterium]MDW8300848.1 response regulator [Bacteroidia bacterium]